MSHKQPPIIVNPSRPSNGNGTRTPVAGLDEHEKISVRALVAYAAMNTGNPEEEIGRRLSTKFDANGINGLPSRSYEDIIKFLIDLCDEAPKKGSVQ